MNPNLDRLQPYPFQKLNKLFEDITPNRSYLPISLHIGEPKHATPELIRNALTANLSAMAHYPTTLGAGSLRASIAKWLKRRYRLPAIDPDSQIIPVNGSREALFSIAQAVIDPSRLHPGVVCPNPFYQIYEGAALLAGATPHFLNTLLENNFALDYAQLPGEVWSHTQLVYVCTPGNPTGRVMSMDEWQRLFELSDRHEFVIVSDECYAEIYFDEAAPPSVRLKPRIISAEKASPGWLPSAACRKDPMYRACVPGSPRATPRYSKNSCSTEPTTAAQ